MDQERARELQGKLVQQAAASLVLTGSGEDVDAYEQVVALIGKAWDLPMSGTAKQLALIEQELGDLNRVTSFVKQLVFVACDDPAYSCQHIVANGSSDLLIELFGEEIGKSARSAIGVYALPGNIPVEIEMIVAFH